MKKERRIIKGALLECLVGAIVLALVGPAASQVTPTSVQAFTNLPTFVVGEATSNVNARITLSQGKGVAITAYFAGTNAVANAVSNVTFTFRLMVDGTNTVTTPSWTLAAPMNGSTAVRVWTNFPAWLTDNSRELVLVSIANGNAPTNRVFVTNVTAFVGH